jgi:hypothetical protein
MDVDVAQQWACLYPCTVTASGTVTFVNGASTVRMLMAVIDTVDCSQVGVTIFVNFHITGGKLEVPTT